MDRLLEYIIHKIWDSYCTYMNEQVSIDVTILTALLTGGFLMLFIENRHIGANVDDRYHFIMKPFMHKLSNYLKFISSAKAYYSINQGDKEEYVYKFKSLLDYMGHLAYPCIMSGQDYPYSKFTAKELEQLSDNINRIWYYWDDKHNYMKGHYIYETEKAEKFATFGHEYLKEVFPSDFKDRVFTLELISDVSGKFYTDIWEPIQDVPFQYEYWQKKDRKFKILSLSTIFLSLLTLAIVLLLRYLIPVGISSFLTILCMAALAISLWKMIKLDGLSRKLFR